jgi:hypothetical protein
MKDNRNKMNDDEYFMDLQEKMMKYAQENPKSRTIRMTAKRTAWIAAALVLMALGSIILLNFNNQPQEVQIAVVNKDTAAALKVDTKVDKTKLPIESTTKSSSLIIEASIKKQVINTVDYEEAEQVIEENMTEDELIEILTEEEIEELLKEYI